MTWVPKNTRNATFTVLFALSIHQGQQTLTLNNYSEYLCYYYQWQDTIYYTRYQRAIGSYNSHKISGILSRANKAVIPSSREVGLNG